MLRALPPNVSERLSGVVLFGPPLYPWIQMSEVTRILESIDRGDPKAAEQLLPLVYNELRKLAAARMAQETPGQTLQATALVHEAWLKLAGSDRQQWGGRAHFFGGGLMEYTKRRNLNRRS